MSTLYRLILTFVCTTFVLNCSSTKKRQNQCRVEINEDKKSDTKAVRIKNTLCKIIASSYPELRSSSITVNTFQGGEIKFRSFFGASRLGGSESGYKIQYDEDVFKTKTPIAAKALEAVLAHELAHTVYYHQRNAFQLIYISRIFLFESSQIEFERATDLETIRRGYLYNTNYIDGLLAYKHWLYPQLNAAQLIVKKRKYFTPEDLELMKLHLTQCKGNSDKQFKRWFEKIPLNYNQLKNSLLKC